ncbi:suppressor of fused domain protein [Arthrobacter sp. Y-9]|uniref:suppressor of fused domain protein n=1 Tax=Arthrobacter sp. Y-9 TaxID=3039385 RepID=UPI00241D1463|nr:suppressor of fused domain protein [Arthrobacter sp. Y-9]WFR85409.1 suppressor of fused domain protein [Arthrobacter sp. Y-9]
MATRVERFLAHLDRLSGGVEPRFFPVESTRPGLPGVTVIVYDDVPSPGMITAVTYGVSLADHPTWRFGKPELCISVTSEDLSWALALGHIAEVQRGDNPFHYGDTINFRESIDRGSDMTSFVIFAPAVLDRADYTGIDVGESRPVNICGLYPIHDAERRYILSHGLEAFWKLGWDPYDVKRRSAVRGTS